MSRKTNRSDKHEHDFQPQDDGSWLCKCGDKTWKCLLCEPTRQFDTDLRYREHLKLHEEDGIIKNIQEALTE